MSKKLDDEYKKLITEEVPDLWERIEAGLPEKNAEMNKAEESFEIEKDNQIEKVTPIWNKRNWKMFITAPACFCVLIISGGVYRLADFGSKSNTTADYMAEDCAEAEEVVAEGTTTEEAADEAPAEEAVSEMTEEAAEEAAELETEAAGDTQKAGSEMADGSRELASKEQVENGMREEEAMQDSVTMGGEAEKSDSKAGTAESLSGLFFDVVVTVESMENTGEEVLYYGTIISADVRPVEVEGKVVFCVSDNEFPEFEVGKTYALQLEDVEPQSSTVHPYVVVEVYE